jgi:hypothetical protein
MHSIGRASLPNDQRTENSIIRAQQSKISLNVCHGLSSLKFASSNFVIEFRHRMHILTQVRVNVIGWLACLFLKHFTCFSFLCSPSLFIYLFYFIRWDNGSWFCCAKYTFSFRSPSTSYGMTTRRRVLVMRKAFENFKDVSHILN